jgi:hypothetical protein
MTSVAMRLREPYSIPVSGLRLPKIAILLSLKLGYFRKYSDKVTGIPRLPVGNGGTEH